VFLPTIFESKKSPHNKISQIYFLNWNLSAQQLLIPSQHSSQQTFKKRGNRWQSVAKLFLVVSIYLSDSSSFWQHLNSKENGEGVR